MSIAPKSETFARSKRAPAEAGALAYRAMLTEFTETASFSALLI
jgi:hypothetical protein